MLSGINLIIFDFDGTLGDTRANIVLTMRQTLSKLGYPVADERAIASTIGLPLETGFAQLLPDLTREQATECALTYRNIFEKNRKQLVPQLFPHVSETLAALEDRGLLMTIASSRNSVSLNGFLQDMGIAPYISYVLGADNVDKAKPDPEPVLKTLLALGYGAEDAIVVGDMPVDIMMGKRAGVRTCAVTYGNASADELLAAGPDCLIDDIAQLTAVI